MLGLDRPQLIVAGFDRPNIYLRVERADERQKDQRLPDLVRVQPRPFSSFLDNDDDEEDDDFEDYRLRRLLALRDCGPQKRG